MRVVLRVAALALVCVGISAAAGRAQEAPLDPAEAARFRFGALRFTPSIAVSSVGVDSNVFNEADDPKQDTTAAVGPAVNLWLKTGAARLSGKASGQYLYFNKYTNQRSWNTNAEGRWDLMLARFVPYIAAGIIDNKDRPGFEIDSRVRLKQGHVNVGTPIRLSGKTTLLLEGGRTSTRYDRNDLVLGDQIANTLDRRTNTEDAQLRVALTPLTVFVIRGEGMHDRFVYDTSRNADSIKVMPGFELKREALVSGQVFVGVRHFNALHDEVPDYTGVVADVNASYSLRATLVQLRVNRDLNFSFELLEPYYAQLDTGLTLTQRITRRWDLVGRGGRQILDYKHVSSAALAARTDRSWQAGAGIGYRPAETLRLGLDAIYSRRDSGSLVVRDYDGLRVGASFSYGLDR